MSKWLLFFMLFLGMIFMLGDKNQLIKTILQQRKEKDRMFKESPFSPLPQQLKAHFTGLKYYPVNLNYRFKVKLQKLTEPVEIDMVTSVGTLRKAIKYGYFDFSVEGKNCRLYVYKLLDVQKEHPNLLFVPFLDATSGKETYSGGRYLDLEENTTDVYILDFNLAYNPYCAYGRPDYICPIPPEENRLPVAIRAGEKKFK